MNERDALAEALSRSWYHTIELAPGQATEGWVDLRPFAPKVLPRELSGKRALDIGTYDGFWAFELEKRDAVEVLAVDLDSHEDSDWPTLRREQLARQVREEGAKPGERFWLAHRALGSRVRRVACSIYDLDVDKLDGPVDYVVIGALLLHLREPVRALERAHSVLADGGRLVVIEPFHVTLSILQPRRPAASMQALGSEYNWWVPNYWCLRGWLRLAGFEPPKHKAMFRLKDWRHPLAALETTRTPARRPSR